MGVTKFTRTGVALYAITIVAFLVCTVVQKVAPESVLGAFLSDDGGLAIAMIIGAIAFGVAAATLHATGHPLFDERTGRDV
jgi:hypothetical protein